MKPMSAPQSPFARKVRAAAIELGLEKAIELVYAEVVPGGRMSLSPKRTIR
jgi:glutathione S-transferase